MTEYDQHSYQLHGASVTVTERDGEVVDVYVSGPEIHSSAGAAASGGELAEITSLSEREARALTLKHAGKSHAEVAEHMDVQRSTAANYYRRARQKYEQARTDFETLRPLFEE